MSSREQDRVSRRGFLQAGAVGAAGAMALGCHGRPKPPAPPPKEAPKETPKAVVEAPPPPPPYGRYEVGAQTYSFREFSFDDMIAKVEQLGLQYVELFSSHLPMNASPQQIADARAKMAARKIAVNAYFVGGLNKDEANDRRILDFVKGLGARVAVGDPPADCFDVLDKVVAETGVQVGIHNHGPGARWSKTDDLLKALANHHANIGVCLDTGHMQRSGENPVESARKLGARLNSLHLKDLNEQNHDVVVGRGRLDLVGLFTVLKELHFSGPISFEYEIEPKDPVPSMAASLEAIRAAIAKVG